MQITVSCKLGQTICLLLRKCSKVRAAKRQPDLTHGKPRPGLAASGRAARGSPGPYSFLLGAKQCLSDQRFWDVCKFWWWWSEGDNNSSVMFLHSLANVGWFHFTSYVVAVVGSQFVPCLLPRSVILVFELILVLVPVLVSCRVSVFFRTM